MVNSSRRNLIRCGAALAATGAMAGSGLITPTRVRAQGAAGQPMPEVKALVFDTFGTVVDWRNGVARESEKLLKPLGYNIDWLAFADAWRKEYGPSMEEVRAGRRPFVKLDILHRENLERVLPRFNVGNSTTRSWRNSISLGTSSTRGRMWAPPLRACTSGS
jgi:hypothetical protein